MRLSATLLFLVLLVGCGQNPAINPIPPPPQPYSNPPGGYIPSGPMNPPGMYQPPPQFRPPFRPPMPPPGMPPYQFQPFMPVYGYFYNQPQMRPYWDNLWQNWTVYAENLGSNQYDFNVFWNEYCPQQWSGTSMGGVYNQINVNYYDLYY